LGLGAALNELLKKLLEASNILRWKWKNLR
jgi:hypothetical protein